MIAALRALHSAIDQALGLLDCLRPALDAWQATAPPADCTAKAKPSLAAARTGANGAARAAICSGCGGRFSPRNGTQRFCSPRCRKRHHAKRPAKPNAAAAVEAEALAPLPDDRPHAARRWQADDRRSDPRYLAPPPVGHGVEAGR